MPSELVVQLAVDSQVVTGDFDTVEGYLAYRDHPDHQRVVREIGMPLIASRAAAQFEC